MNESINDLYMGKETINATTPIAVMNHMRVLDQVDEINQVRILLAVSRATELMAREIITKQIRKHQVSRKEGLNLTQTAQIWGITKQGMAAMWKRWQKTPG